VGQVIKFTIVRSHLYVHYGGPHLYGHFKGPTLICLYAAD